jgi:hypothetical protein
VETAGIEPAFPRLGPTYFLPEVAVAATKPAPDSVAGNVCGSPIDYARQSF